MVRRGRSGDVEALVGFSVAMARESEGLVLDPGPVRRATSAALEDPAKARYFVAEAGGKVVGSLFVTQEWSDWRGGWYWWIQGVYVVPGWRGRGVYRALHEGVRQAAQEAGDVRAIRLYVEQGNEAARAVYEAMGMAETPYRVYEEAVPDADGVA